MLTTTVDGLWALQVLTGIEVVAPELRLRPHLPSVEPKRLALEHPITAELRAAGVIDEAGTVDNVVVEWLSVLSRRDIALFAQFRIPDDDEPAGVLLARFAQWWVTMERCGDLIRISGAGTADSEDAAIELLAAQIDRLCGDLGPASLRPVTLDADALQAAARSHGVLQKFLAGERMDPDQLRALLLASDPDQSAQVSIVATQAGVPSSGAGRTHVEDGALAIVDTPEGRVIAESVRSGGKKWLIVGPGTRNNVVSAIKQMLRRLPADKEWHSYRKVV